VSRRVRLRRTIAGAAVLALLAVAGAKLIDRDHAAAAVNALPGVAASATTSADPVHAVSGDAEDGSAADATRTPQKTTIPQHGSGQVHVVAVPNVDNPATGREVRYTVEIEGGLGVDEAQVASTIQTILLDKRGWQGVDQVQFVNVSPQEAEAGAKVDVRVTLASPALTDKLCLPMKTMSQVSCWNGERSVLNFKRWALGDDSYGDDVARYRIYQVNHEVGHGIGHLHKQCPAKGERAPVMVQQTLSLGGCTPWPYPSGA
jgi:Protein of unknown function (DUF3152)